MNVKINKKPGVTLPSYSHDGDAGMDIRAFITTPIKLERLQRVLVPTGIGVEIPKGFEIQVRPRSGLALKDGISVLNSPGTIDEGFRGEIGIILINLSNDEFVINPNDRIAQIVLNKFETVVWDEVKEVSNSERGSGGFGSTGKS